MEDLLSRRFACLFPFRDPTESLPNCFRVESLSSSLGDCGPAEFMPELETSGSKRSDRDNASAKIPMWLDAGCQYGGTARAGISTYSSLRNDSESNSLALGLRWPTGWVGSKGIPGNVNTGE